MDVNLTMPLLTWLQTFSAETLSLILVILCCSSVLLLLRCFGLNGLYLYNVVAVIAANIQVLKLSDFWFFREPLALGTIAFASSFLVSDIITELYGRPRAQKGIWLCVAGQILFALMMLLTLGHQPAAQDTAHNAMFALFAPSVRILAASLIAFGASQFVDVWVFQTISYLTRGKILWFRTTLASLLSGLVDNFIFSFLAWNLLSSEPVGLRSLIIRYIFGTYLARMVVAVLSIPTIYMSRILVPHELTPH